MRFVDFAFSHSMFGQGVGERNDSYFRRARRRRQLHIQEGRGMFRPLPPGLTSLMSWHALFANHHRTALELLLDFVWTSAAIMTSCSACGHRADFIWTSVGV